MNTVQILEQLQDLKLSGMHESYKMQLELPLNQQLEGHELLAHLLQSEKHHRGNERLAALLRAAKLRYAAQPQSVECNTARNLTKANWAQLMEGNYITASENILITGATGSGYVKQMIMQSILFNLLIINYTYLSYLALCF